MASSSQPQDQQHHQFGYQHTQIPFVTTTAPRREQEPAYLPQPTDTDEEAAGDSGGGPPKKKRRRQALSCTECKRRKIKCDRNQPCSQCSRRGESAKCVWSVVEPVEKYVTRSEYDELKTRFDQLEGLVHTRLLPLLSAAGLPGALAYYQHTPEGGQPPSTSFPYASGPGPGPGPGGILYPPLTFAPQGAASAPPVTSPRQSPSLARRGIASSSDPKSPHSLATITSPYAPPVGGPEQQQQQPKNCYAQMFILSVRLRISIIISLLSLSLNLHLIFTTLILNNRWLRLLHICMPRCTFPHVDHHHNTLSSSSIRERPQVRVLVPSLVAV